MGDSPDPPMRAALIFERVRQLPDADGKTCRVCTGPIPKGRLKSYCSESCRVDAGLMMSPSFARFKVEERDKGVCGLCGLDTEYLKSLLNPLLMEAVNRAQVRHEYELARALRERVGDVLVEFGFSGSVASAAAGQLWSGVISTHLWEMDHIVPVAEGGGACGMDNLRTLCRACHRKATHALAGRRAKTKRLQSKQKAHEARMKAKQMRLMP